MAAKVILVEPDEAQRQEFLNAIRGSPFEICQFAKTNAEAVEMCGEARPHVIVMRLVSGKMGAVAAMSRLAKMSSSIRVVVSYTVGTTHLLMSAYGHGAVSAIKQPFGRHRVVEKLTFAVASEKHDKLSGPIVRLEHPFEVRYKAGSLLSFSKPGFCERLGLGDMDLNTEKSLKLRAKLKLELLLPPPTEPMRFVGSVENVEMTRPRNWCSYITLKHVSSSERKAISAFLVKAAKQV